MTKHNKRSNVGLIYEFLLRNMSKSLTENKPETFNKSKEIIQKFFNRETEIHKEFRLINALVNESVGSPEHATLILEEVRKTASGFDGDMLVKEKFLLVVNCLYKKPFNALFGLPAKNPYGAPRQAHQLIIYLRTFS